MTPTDSQAARLHEVVPPSPVNHRYLFEEWLRQHHPDRPILTVSAADDRYLSPDTSLAWSAWDAAWNTRPREDAGVVDAAMVDAALFCTPINEYGEDMEMPIDAMGLGSIQQLPRARLIMKAALVAALGRTNG